MTDNFTGKAVVLVTLGVGRKGSCLATYPGVQRVMEGTSPGAIMSWLRQDGQQVDKTV